MDLEKQARTVDVDVRFDALPADMHFTHWLQCGYRNHS